MSLLGPETEQRRKHDLEMLKKVVTGIGRIRNAESLQWQLLGLLFDMVPAERAIMVRDGQDHFAPAISWDKVLGPSTPVEVSPSLMRKVVQDRQGVLQRVPIPRQFLSLSLPDQPRCRYWLLRSSDARRGLVPHSGEKGRKKPVGWSPSFH
jgi:hypothetical protein